MQPMQPCGDGDMPIDQVDTSVKTIWTVYNGGTVFPLRSIILSKRTRVFTFEKRRPSLVRNFSCLTELVRTRITIIARGSLSDLTRVLPPQRVIMNMLNRKQVHPRAYLSRWYGHSSDNRMSTGRTLVYSTCTGNQGRVRDMYLRHSKMYISCDTAMANSCTHRTTLRQTHWLNQSPQLSITSSTGRIVNNCTVHYTTAVIESTIERCSTVPIELQIL